MTDPERERLICWHGDLFLRHSEAGRIEVAREHWKRMCGLIEERTRDQVERMEQRFFNDGREASRLAAPQPACQPSPNQVEDGAGGAR